MVALPPAAGAFSIAIRSRSGEPLAGLSPMSAMTSVPSDPMARSSGSRGLIPPV